MGSEKPHLDLTADLAKISSGPRSAAEVSSAPTASLASWGSAASGAAATRCTAEMFATS